jgi:miniconductance mechanosensitive channel
MLTAIPRIHPMAIMMLRTTPAFALQQAAYPDWMPIFLQTPVAQAAVGVTVLAVVALLLHLVARSYLLRAVHLLVRHTRVDWDRVIFDHKVPHRASLIIPLIAVRNGIEWVPALPAEFVDLVLRVVAATMILVGAATLDSMLSALHSLYQRLPSAATRPIKSYIQLLKVFIYIIAAVFIIAQLANTTPWFFVSGLGAMMAIILLIFRDTLLSLVASVQLTNNDLIRVGDWIEMPQFGADGDVVDIALNTVKVQNWDRTITVIPTHKFLEHSFKNWRNMFEGGGRRIKRSVHVDMSTIRFLNAEEIEHFSRYVLLKDYMEQKTRELKEYNAQFCYDPSLIPNARRLTNLGTLRAYIAAYLRSRTDLRHDLIFLVRQLQPTPEGLPIEIYVFTNDTRWVVYEGIQADIFDHIFAMAPEFGLRVFQNPSGSNIEALRGPERRALLSVAAASHHAD